MKARSRNILSIIENSLFWCQYSNVLTEIRQEYGFLPHSSLKRYKTILALHETTERISKEIHTLSNRRAAVPSADNPATADRLVYLCRQLIAYQREKVAHASAALLELRQAQNSIAYCNLKHADDASVAQVLTSVHSFQQSLFQQGQTADAAEAQFGASDLFACYRNFSASGLLGPSPYLPLNPHILEPCYMPDFNDLQMKTAGGKTTSGFSPPEIVKSNFPYTAWLTPEQQRGFNIDESEKARAWSILLDNSYAAHTFYKSCSSFLGLVSMMDFDVTFEDFCKLNECDPQQSADLFQYWSHSYNTLKILSESVPIDEFTYFKLRQLEENSKYRYCPNCQVLVALGEECQLCHYNGFAWIMFQPLSTELDEPRLKLTRTSTNNSYQFPPNFFMKVLRDPIRLLREIQQMLKKALQWYNGLLKQKVTSEPLKESSKEPPKDQGHGVLATPVLTLSSIIGSGSIRWTGVSISNDITSANSNRLEAGTNGDMTPGSASAANGPHASMRQTNSIKNTKVILTTMEHASRQDVQLVSGNKQSYPLFLKSQAELSSSDRIELSDEVTVLYEQTQPTASKPPRSSVRKQGHRRSSQEPSMLSSSVSEHSVTGVKMEVSCTYDAVSTNTDATEAGYCFCSKSNKKVCSDDMICCESNNCKFANEGWFHVDCLGLRSHSNETDVMSKLESVEFYCPGCYVEILKKHINGWPMLFPFLTTTEQRQALLEYVIKQWQENFSMNLDRASRQIRREATSHLHHVAAEPEHDDLTAQINALGADSNLQRSDAVAGSTAFPQQSPARPSPPRSERPPKKEKS
ncbi:hypothetical protein GL50803_0017596 [Giardia duodenalis]|uniref:Uncharacterized protein n=1 Tax=Giardia intestinalis (strain ATCC 50803 / WB clone C6) TaxID=184922 RepID=A8B4W1_GIAIC|nr:hypothetical protein GL50803_0017596 [Giardia intestinalis]KAE8303785.1 hypothetical protein GL50803_0017596 [Giardia intestinalis]|eukprot:XP_001709710.1 Hypothetical protein GL50803_17596 [Giardia lamblia ATCC 50803]